MKSLDGWDKFKYSLYTGLGAAATQMGGVMANSSNIEITNTLLLTTALTFVIHYTATSNKFIQEKIDSFKQSKVE